MAAHTFIHYGYHGKSFTPTLTLLPDNSNEFTYLTPAGQDLTLRFDLNTRTCTGWHDLASSQSFPCPNQASLTDTTYHQCRSCQQKTGFNPAFYHATSVSPQQQARNSLPHFLYLAHFAPGVVKVGISWANRGIARLLDQGARSCLIVKTYPTAEQARQYEAKIASLPGIAENLKVSSKHKLLTLPYDTAAGHQELAETLKRIQNEFTITPDNTTPLDLSSHYGQFDPMLFVHIDGPHISGKALGMIGSTLLMEQDGSHFGLSLHKLAGHRVEITEALEQNTHAPQQARLF